MLTLVHEDIYVYIDKIEEQVQTLSGANSFALSNNATDLVVDQGVVKITVASGSYTALTLSDGTTTLTISKPLATGDVMVIDLRDRFYTLNDVPFFLDNYLELKDDTNNNLTLSLTGTGTANVTYTRNQVVQNNNDLFFCTGIDVQESSDVIKKTNIKAQTKTRKTAKKDNTWSINGLWNDTELQKFESGTGLFRLRLIDEDGIGLEKLANCVVATFQRNSTDNSDYTYNISGSFDKIF